MREILDGWTDPHWEAKERGYHEASVRALNETIRKYNVIAPYHVSSPRRPSTLRRSRGLD